MLFDFELSRGSLRRLLIIVLAVMMIFSQFAVIGYADDGYDQAYAANESTSGDAGEDPVVEPPLIIDYDGDEVGFYKEDGTAVSMFLPQEGTSAYIKDEMVEITYFPKSVNAFKGFHYGLTTDEDLTVDVPLVDSKFKLSVPVEMCGKGMAVAFIRNSDGGAANTQYYLCIPSADKITSSEDPGDPSGNAGNTLFAVDDYGLVTWQTEVDVFGCTVGVYDDYSEAWLYSNFDESEVRNVFLQRIINELYAENNLEYSEDYNIYIRAWDESGNTLIEEEFGYGFAPHQYGNNKDGEYLTMAIGDTVYVNLLCNDLTLPDYPDIKFLGDAGNPPDDISVNQVQGADEKSVGNTRMFSITAVEEGYVTIVFYNSETNKEYARYDVNINASSGDISGNAGDASGNAVESISTNLTRLSIIEGTNGYMATNYIWDDNTQTSIEDKFFMYQTWEIIKREDTQIIVNGDDVYSYGWGYNPSYECEDYGFYNENGEWLDYYVSDDQYNNHWKLGGVYTVTINYMGQSCEFQVEIVDSPIDSIEFIPAEEITLMENMGGYMDSVQRYDEDIHEWVTEEFYYYYDHHNRVYSDGSRIIVNGSEEFTFDEYWQNDKPDFINADGEFLSEKYGDLEISDDQRNVNWTVGSNNYFTISLLGKTFDCPVTIVKNPIKSIEFVPVEKLYVYEGDGTQYDWGFEYDFDYNEHVYRDGAKVIINGTEEFTYHRCLPEGYTSYIYEFIDKDGKTIPDRYDGYNVNFNLNYSENGIVLYAELIGVQSDPTTVSIIASPIDSITFTSDTGVDLYEEDIVSDYYENPLDRPWAEGDTLTVSYKDGNSEVYTYGYKAIKNHDGYGYLAQGFYNDNGFITADKIRSVGNIDVSEWTAPGQYSIEFMYKGVTFSVDINYLKNNIEAIQFEPVNPYILLENTDGNWETAEDGVTEYFCYNTPYMFTRTNGNRLTVTYEGGEQKVYTYYNNYFRDENGQILKGRIEVNSNQESKPWNVGSDNYCEIAYGGCTCSVPVTILGHDSIESVRFVSGERIAYRVPGTDRDYYYIAGFYTGEAVEVTYADGTVSRFTYQYHPVGIYEKNFVNEDGVVLNITGQSAIGPDENSWELFVLGQTISGTFIIKDSDVKSVSVNVNHPVYAKDYDCEGFIDTDGTEYVSCWWMGRAGDSRDIRPYAIFRQGDAITVTDNSGNETAYTFQESKDLYGFYDSEGNELSNMFLNFWDNGVYSWNDPYNDDQYWSSDKENEIYVYYLGQKAKEPIKVYLNEQAKILIDKADVTVEDAVYSGSELEPAVTVTYEGEALKEGVDYTLEYSNNINAGIGEVTVTGICQYAGDKTVEFTIEPLKVTPELILSASEFTYNGEVQKPEVTVKANGNVIPAEVTFSGNCIDAGTYTVSVELTGNIMGSNSAGFEILRAEVIPEVILSETEFTYNSETQYPNVSVKANGKEVPAKVNMPVESINAGNYSIIVSLTGNYKGEATVYYEIKPLEVTPEIILTPAKVTYNGQVQKPSVAVKANGTVVDAEVEMTGDFINAGVYDVKATVSGNYVGTNTVQFMIMPADIGNGKMTGLPEKSVYYDGETKTYDIAVEFNSATLTGGKDYTIEYQDNVQPGTAIVTAIGKGNFIGSLTGTFKIIYKEGWFKEDGEWYYYEKSEKVTNKWMKDSKGWCYLGADGKMVTNGWAKDSKGYCWIGPEGYMVTDTKWIKDGENWYYIKSGYRAVNQWQKDGKGWMYLGEDGLPVTSVWKKDSQGWCWLQDNGYMLTNNWAKDSKGWCWIGSNGYMIEKTQWIQKDGKWYHITNGYRDENKWMKDSKGWCWLQEDGSMLTNGWVKDSKGYCWIGSAGYMEETTKWFKIGSDWYHITKGYRDQSKWMKDSSGWCYLAADGRMVTNGFVKDSTGWCWIGEKGYMIEKDMWIGEPGAEGSSYIVKGYRVDNQTIKIDGVEYTFDKDGRLNP